jgi:hypothetical protein
MLCAHNGRALSQTGKRWRGKLLARQFRRSRHQILTAANENEPEISIITPPM